MASNSLPRQTQPSAINTAICLLCESVARAISASLPPGFRGKFTITVDNGVVYPHNVAVEIRPPQMKDPV